MRLRLGHTTTVLPLARVASGVAVEVTRKLQAGLTGTRKVEGLSATYAPHAFARTQRLSELVQRAADSCCVERQRAGWTVIFRNGFAYASAHVDGVELACAVREDMRHALDALVGELESIMLEQGVAA